jgi:hypothetical protein
MNCKLLASKDYVAATTTNRWAAGADREWRPWPPMYWLFETCESSTYLHETSSPRTQAGLALRSGFRLRSLPERTRAGMNANQSVGCQAIPSFAAGRTRSLKIKPDGPPSSITRIIRIASDAIARSGMGASLMNGFFCISLWLSLLLALWMCRGWIGLLFSGQVLSAGTCLMKRLALKTQHALSRNGGPNNRLEGEHHVH